jgi:hypothetical protein
MANNDVEVMKLGVTKEQLKDLVDRLVHGRRRGRTRGTGTCNSLGGS